MKTHICAAYLELVGVFMQAKQYAIAEQTRNAALTNYKCPPEEFEKVMAAKPQEHSDTP